MKQKQVVVQSLLNIITYCQSLHHWICTVNFSYQIEFCLAIYWKRSDNDLLWTILFYIHTLVCLLATSSAPQPHPLLSVAITVGCSVDFWLDAMMRNQNSFSILRYITLVWRLSTGLLSSPWWTCELVGCRLYQINGCYYGDSAAVIRLSNQWMIFHLQVIVGNQVIKNQIW